MQPGCPFYEYQPLEKLAREVRLLSFGPNGDQSLSATLKECLAAEDSDVGKWQSTVLSPSIIGLFFGATCTFERSA
jgi:hypothetical protein